ncbi:unnamed protein product [Cyprideis torosa]|uniref:Uncharacterized protein n=1 Tax=Cyprideis torosa TaxID=163714 RepID=A0A7R8WAU0_9CRUS|nr:unnamed protein product [Cyprideis torosa]CAG0885664.1 unnamed protein product [Cyprideis torosa]
MAAAKKRNRTINGGCVKSQPHEEMMNGPPSDYSGDSASPSSYVEGHQFITQLHNKTRQGIHRPLVLASQFLILILALRLVSTLLQRNKETREFDSSSLQGPPLRINWKGRRMSS